MHVAAHGHRIIVVQPPSRQSTEANDIDVVLREHSNVKVITVPISSAFWNAKFPMEKLLKKLYFTFRSAAMVRRICKSEQIDLLYLYNIPQALYLLGCKTRVLFDFADDLMAMLKVELSISEHHLLYRLADAVLGWMVRRSAVVICISAPLFDKIDHPHKFIIPNGAGLPADGVGVPRPSTFTVGYVGAFEYSMDLDLMIAAAERLPQYPFLLIGAGRDFARIKESVERKRLANVELTGALSHDEAMRLLSGMDVCLNLFHKTEVSHAVSPLKLFEYLMRSKPAISTRLKEVERIDEHFLYYADTVDEVVERIEYIAAHRTEARAMAEHGKDVVLKKFSWDTIACDFLQAVSASPKKESEIAV
jgi:glycosyltransferase involved in cell wall biosynthesis